jgi:hypothetical protein
VFFAFLAVGVVVILVYASRPVSNPSIQSDRGAATTRPRGATTSSTTLGTLPQLPTEVKGESAISATAKPAPAAAAPTAPPTTAAPTAPPTTAAPTAPPTTAPPTAPPTTEPPATKKPPPGLAKK